MEIVGMAWNCKYFSLILNEHLLEEGLNMWPKHVANYTVYNTINLNISTCNFWPYVPQFRFEILVQI
jgi:hypothetical protein